MKKLVFAAIAALVMVSVSNVFASSKMSSVSMAEPTDTVAPADTTVNSTDTTVTPAADNSTSLVAPADTVAPTDTTATAE